MDLLFDGIDQAFRLLIQPDQNVLDIVFLSLQVSVTATLISLTMGIPLGTSLALSEFRGRRLMLSLVNVGMGLPPVVVGLMVAVMLWRSGPLGFLGVMYTPAAIIVAQSLIALPIITGLTVAAIQQLNPKLQLQILALGATRWQLLVILVREARVSLLAATIAGFGAIISEVGASMMVGGNIYGQTRVLTTAMVMETGKGNFEFAFALSVLLFIIAYAVTLALTSIQQVDRSM